jgi:hypothetical protein
MGDLTSSAVDLHVGAAAKGSGAHVEPLFDEPRMFVVGSPAYARNSLRRGAYFAPSG